MLLAVTSIVDFLGMAVSLWLGLYLLGRGFSSRITLRGVAVLTSVAAFFLGAYINLYEQIIGTAAIRAVFLTIGLSVWNDLTHKLLPNWYQKTQRWRVGIIYTLGLITVVLLLWKRTAFVGEQGNELWVARMGIEWPYVVYGAFQILASASILYNFRVGGKVGVGPQNGYFLAASLLAVSTVVYGLFALALTPPMPRLIQDALILSSVTVLGFSVARYQTLVERRGTFQDFAISTLAVFVLSDIYLFIAWQMGLPPITLILVTALSIFSHSIYSLVRESLDRSRSRDESTFRQQLRRLEANFDGNIPLKERLQSGLKLLCQILESTGAFIAVRQEEQYIVLASHHSIPVGNTIPFLEKVGTHIFPPAPGIANHVAWLVPAFQSGDLVAILGIGPLRSRLQYTEDDLDLLAEAVDQIGIMIYLQSHKPAHRDRSKQRASDLQAYKANLQDRSEKLITTLITNPDPQFIKIVEDGLRNLTDFISLSQSSLAECLGVAGDTHIEKGKAVQLQLIQAIEALRPGKECPGEPIPREWHSYVVLHDAYWEGIPNHDIMSKLYISEGTFHRTRRAAVRSVGRVLLEKKNPAQIVQ
jgi:hypothetical protein